MTKASEIMKRLNAVDMDRIFIDFSNMSLEAFETIVIAILGDYEIGITSYQKDIENVRDALREAFAELEARAMPEGYEWPRYEGGGLVNIGGSIVSPESGECGEVVCINFFSDSWYFGLVGASSERLEFGERVKRPKVLAADGEPLEPGQTVWNANNGMEFTVSRLPKPGEYQAVEVRYRNGSSTSFDPDHLTHQRPVLDADGVPIKVCDRVWLLDDSGRAKCECEVVDTCENDGEFSVMVKEAGKYGYSYVRPSSLTHTKPEPIDTWERIEEDKDLNPFEYCKEVGHKLDTCENAERFKANDIVRRCKRLAGVS